MKPVNQCEDERELEKQGLDGIKKLERKEARPYVDPLSDGYSVHVSLWSCLACSWLGQPGPGLSWIGKSGPGLSFG